MLGCFFKIAGPAKGRVDNQHVAQGCTQGCKHKVEASSQWSVAALESCNKNTLPLNRCMQTRVAHGCMGLFDANKRQHTHLCVSSTQF